MAVYEVLELDPSGDRGVAALKRARRRLLLKQHPDKNNNTKGVERTQAFNAMWEKLADRYLQNINGVYETNYWKEVKNYCEVYQAIMD